MNRPDVSRLASKTFPSLFLNYNFLYVNKIHHKYDKLPTPYTHTQHADDAKIN